MPEQNNPQAWDRYAYSYNNSVRYSDPSGHCVDGITTLVCAAVAVGFFTMAIDYGVQLVSGQTEYLGAGCMWSSCGGFTDYLRDRGAGVWAASSIINTITLGATTPAGAVAILGENAATSTITGEAIPIVNNVLGVGVTNGAANVAQGFLTNVILGEPIETDYAGRDFVTGFGVGVSLSGLSKLQELSVASEQLYMLNQYDNIPKITIGGIRFPRPPSLPSSTDTSEFIGAVTDGLDAGFMTFDQIKEK